MITVDIRRPSPEEIILRFFGLLLTGGFGKTYTTGSHCPGSLLVMSFTYYSRSLPLVLLMLQACVACMPPLYLAPQEEVNQGA
jgi:hypothetical protein